MALYSYGSINSLCRQLGRAIDFVAPDYPDNRFTCHFRYRPMQLAKSTSKLSAARWEVAMLRIIQANDLALKLNVLAVCAVFVFVGVVLLGAF
jgi:hypothetical protein